jgi:hypothetical protein
MRAAIKVRCRKNGRTVGAPKWQLRKQSTSYPVCPQCMLGVLCRFRLDRDHPQPEPATPGGRLEVPRHIAKSYSQICEGEQIPCQVEFLGVGVPQFINLANSTKRALRIVPPMLASPANEFWRPLGTTLPSNCAECIMGRIGARCGGHFHQLFEI